MASLKGMMPTERFPGAPTLTVFSVRTEGAGAAAEIAGTASAEATRRVRASARRRFCRTLGAAWRIGIVPHRQLLKMLKRNLYKTDKRKKPCLPLHP